MLPRMQPEEVAMSSRTVWHGTPDESLALLQAITRNCGCEFGLRGVRLSVCGPHRMLTEDQRALDGLLFARRMADCLRREEVSTTRAAHVEC